MTRDLSASVFAPLGAELVALAGLGAGDRWLDVGCGAGTVARAAERLGSLPEHFVGVDPNLDRLASAPGGRCRARGEALPFASEVFSCVTCQHAIMFFAEPDVGLCELHRVSRGGGRLFATVWAALDRNPAFQALDTALLEELGTGGAAAVRRPFSWSDPEHGLARFRGAGFRDAAAIEVPFQMGFGSARDFTERFCMSTSVAPLVRAGSDGTLDRIAERVRAGLALPEAPTLPAVALCLRGTRASPQEDPGAATRQGPTRP